MLKSLLAILSVTCLVILAGQFKSNAVKETTILTVTAGEKDRRETVVSFNSPKGLKTGSYGLRDESGKVIHLQVNSRGLATFVLAELKSGGTKKYELTAPPADSGVTGARIVREKEKISIEIAGRKVLTYRGEGELPNPEIKPIFKRGGYIHPVYTPSGRIVSDDYPPNHVHHHGIWFAWTRTQFEERQPDFWNMGTGSGTVEFVALDETWGGPVDAGFRARHRYVDLSGAKTALNEFWEVIAYNVGKGAKSYIMFDLVSTQECATKSPLILPKYHYGGMAFRGHRSWDGKDNSIFLTSESKDRGNGNETRARWCHINGRIDGEPAGLTMLSHPGNFRAPQPVRIHPTEPYFTFAPSQMGEWKIAPDSPYTSRYRYLVTDGPPDAVELERLWSDYAYPPLVTISVK
jgi:Methane oxygenase PmoA